MKEDTRKVFLRTFGCQMNEYDSELIKSILLRDKFIFVETECSADIILLNTCSVRENAHLKVYGRIYDIHHKYTDKNHHVKIGILGCMATNLREELLHDKRLKIDFIADVTPVRDKGVNAWIAIMRGCNNFCSFCIVPYTRSRERSRLPQNIINEVKNFVRDGFRQVTLLGQNVNSYSHDNTDFAQLLDKRDDGK